MQRVILVLLTLGILFTMGCSSTTAEPNTLTTNPEPTAVTTPPETFTEIQPVIPENQHTPSPETTNRDLNQQQIELARQIYNPGITNDLLRGLIPVPDGFDAYIVEQIGEARFAELRAGSEWPTGQENDIAALVLMQLGVAPESLKVSSSPVNSGNSISRQTEVSMVNSQYRVAPGNLTGWFKNGQSADMLLGGIDFNNTGGPLLFNHPKGIASDGTHLLLADGNNNRVLIWNSLPQSNTPPDIVLGQADFTSNNPGTGLNQMNWPVGVTTDGQRVLVADTYNDRILIWNEFPTQNGAPADIVLDGRAGSAPFGQVSKTDFGWPWGIWTDGEKMAISSTSGGYVLIWNSFPTRDDQPADLYLTAGGDMGTPRTITSDGKHLIVGDHNAKNTSNNIGNFFWSAFPTTDDEPYDFFSPDPLDSQGAWLQGDFTTDGKLVMLGSTLHVWDEFPSSENDKPAVSISDFRFSGGDGAGAVMAGDKVYVSVYNGNRILVYNHVPDEPSDLPDFAIGSSDIYTNTLDTHYFITNGIPATNGDSLFVSSDFDRKLYVWENIPDESGAYPDFVYSFDAAPWDNALCGDTLVLAGKDTVLVWRQLPLDGQLPDDTWQGGIGGISFQDLQGVALDDKYFYLSDANKVYVWEGVPENDESPSFTIDVDGPGRLSSDGEYLVVTSLYNHKIYLYRIDGLSADSKPVTIGGVGKFNLPQNAIVSKGSLFIADTGFNQVNIWRSVDDAFSGKDADVILGNEDRMTSPEIGRSTLFWPAGLAFDGSYLWVSEFKFSGRLLRFAIQ
jgi:hypothetical protein